MQRPVKAGGRNLEYVLPRWYIVNIKNIAKLIAYFRTIIKGRTTLLIQVKSDHPAGFHPKAFHKDQLHAFRLNNGLR